MILGQSPLFAQESDDQLVIQKTEDFELTGKGDAEPWSATDWVAIPQRKKDGVEYATEFKLLYSSTGIYVLFRCEDEKITATMQEDFDDLYREDVVEVFFWTDESLPIYFEYELSPLNKELAILVPNMDGTFLGWRPWHYEGDRLTRHEASIDDTNSWTAEIFIPFSLLKPLRNVPPESGTKWRLNLYRIDYDQGMNAWAWKPIRTNFHDYPSYGSAVFE